MLCTIQYGRGNSSRDETDDDEDGAANAGLVVCEAVRHEDLVEETGDGVEDADVDGEGDEDEPYFERADGGSDGWEEWHLWCF